MARGRRHIRRTNWEHTGLRDTAIWEHRTGDLWVDPLVVSYLNIGYRRLERSLAHFTLHHRPDVLFLGDLGVASNEIGRLKQTLAHDLGVLSGPSEISALN